VNALAITPPASIGPLGLIGLNPAISGLKASATANGFENLISALFGSESEAQPSVIASRSNVAAKAAPEKKIADAMIRSMLGNRRESPKSKTPVIAEANQSTRSSLQVVVSKLTTIEAKPQPADQDEPQNSGAEPITAEANPSQPAINGSIQSTVIAGPPAPIAFQAILTPANSAALAAQSSEPPLSESITAISSTPAFQAPVPQNQNSKETPLARPTSPVDPKDPSREAEAPTKVLAAAQSSFSADSLAKAFEPAPSQAMPQTQGADTKPAAAFADVAHALRTSETPVTTAIPAANSPIHDISIRIARPDQPAIDLRIAERAGEIHVDVRTPDAPLAASLRQELPTLTNSLERAGYRAETFVPHQGVSQAAEPSRSNAHDDRQQQSSSNRDAQQFSQNRQQRHRDRNFEQWLNEMEKQS